MIYAFNFTCSRDAELAELMTETLMKYGKEIAIVTSVNTDTNEPYQGFQNGAGWPQGMLKIKYLRFLLSSHDVKDDDFILSIDSDVIITSPEVFKYIDPQHGIIGTQHQQPYNTHYGKFGHMSGAMIFIRGDIAKKIAAITDEEFDRIRYEHFKPFNITENEDVMLSYFAKHVGAESFDIGSVPNLTSGNFESDVYRHKVQRGIALKSFYHLNYCPTTFLDVAVDGKWWIPKVLKMKGIEL